MKLKLEKYLKNLEVGKMNYCSICGSQTNLAHWKGEDFLLCEKCRIKRKLVKAPAKEKLDLLKRCSKCIFVLGCIYMPDSEICKKLLNNNKI